MNEQFSDKVIVCRNIAESIFWLGGPDLRNLSDEELVQRIEHATAKMADAVRLSGLSADEAAKSFKALSGAYKTANVTATDERNSK